MFFSFYLLFFSSLSSPEIFIVLFNFYLMRLVVYSYTQIAWVRGNQIVGASANNEIASYYLTSA
jgi:hypothetical protein